MLQPRSDKLHERFQRLLINLETCKRLMQQLDDGLKLENRANEPGVFQKIEALVAHAKAFSELQHNAMMANTAEMDPKTILDEFTAKSFEHLSAMEAIVAELCPDQSPITLN